MMVGNNNILVAVDGSKMQDKLISKLMEEISHKTVNIILLRVIETPFYLMNMAGQKHIMDKVTEYIKEELLTLKKSINDGYPNIKVTTFIKYGDPKRKIASFVSENGIPLELIIMGVTGESEENMAGSTTAYVVNHAPCDVLVVR